ncbi:hypothetical protein WI61_34305 [Burkholderia cepacia]|uniref:hypothetical protein n=1 Tax=Burkholderia cepacia TaxID=292 RepID=UPI000758AEED|nr:hypothetical protein [Burkholderia cepacia]KVA57197.1 hypothetical protein WI49_30235 [Burkholderia cepacia]KVA60568.1 hypothetical protein WI48_12575 [Burkholderia cepacia]KVA85045.1 hypothetical protein WI51_01050 [Burkholderia cepacia]KVA88343.1 hypothetical protein WI52_11260 [Burkholderia cepacia]KVA94653.1 hypothetical protein WI50_37925 [Burkholderia cepacia]
MEILADAEYWQALLPLGVTACRSVPEVLALFSEHGIHVTFYDVKNESKRHYIELASLTV